MPYALNAAAAQIREQAAAYCEQAKVPGYLAGVYHDGGQAVVAHGTANMVTGAPMREDTGFLFGSVTKVLTTTLVLQQAERGTVDLDERVVTYLPEFTLTTPAAADGIAISAYATPAILGGPATQVAATAIYNFIIQLLDWSLGAALAVVLIVSTLLLLYAASRVGSRKAVL